MKFSGWKDWIFSDFVSINPTISLKGGGEFSFIEMKDLSEGQRIVKPSAEKKVTGGARFREGNTLFARITPCLENGKIGQAEDLKDGIGFGSTEFLVFEEKENISDKDFIYYLACWQEVRKFAEQNMIGTSGRQRVGKDVFSKLELRLPDLGIQQKIASILSSLDDKIELNRQTNQTLEAMAQALFTEMCLQNGEGLPAAWRVGKLGDEIETVSETYKFGDKEEIIFLNTGDISNGLFLHANYSAVATLPGQAKKRIRKNDILFSEIRPINKRFAFVNFDAEEYVVSTKLMVLRSKNLSPVFLYFYLTREEMIKNLQHIAETRSGTFPQITFSQLENMPIVLPSPEVLEKFVNILEQNFLLQKKNEQENQTLTSLRDGLLPKLMKGEFTKIKNKNDS